MTVMEKGKPAGQYRRNPQDATTKRCPECEVVKPLDDFYRNKSSADGRGGYCRPCQLAYMRTPKRAKHAADYQRERHADPALKRRHVDKQREAHLRRRYGLAVEDYDAMVEAQGGVCLLCKHPQKDGRRLAVDHCHDSGRVRGLLCNACNVLLHKIETRAVSIEAVAVYLKDPA